MIDKRLIEAIVIGICAALIILIQKYYMIRNIHFICNSNECRIIHKHSSGRIISQQDININDIAEFTYKLERNNSNRNIFLTKSQRRYNRRQAYHIYIKCKDGKEYLIKYVSLPKDYLYRVMELTDKLNSSIKDVPINIDMDLPARR